MWTCTPPPAVPPPYTQRGVGCKSTFSYLFPMFFIFLGKGQFIRFPYQFQLTSFGAINPARDPGPGPRDRLVPGP